LVTDLEETEATNDCACEVSSNLTDRPAVTELSEAVSEKDNIMVIAKLVINLMKQNGCWSSYAAQSLSIQCKWRYIASRKVTVSLTLIVGI
jgi:hypothetical protein